MSLLFFLKMSNYCSIAARCYQQTVLKALLYYVLKKGGETLIHTIQLEVILYFIHLPRFNIYMSSYVINSSCFSSFRLLII